MLNLCVSLIGSMKSFLLIVLLLVSLLFVGCINTSVAPQQCAGIRGALCPEGYACQYDQNPERVADASGHCVRKS